MSLKINWTLKNSWSLWLQLKRISDWSRTHRLAMKQSLLVYTEFVTLFPLQLSDYPLSVDRCLTHFQYLRSSILPSTFLLIMTSIKFNVDHPILNFNRTAPSILLFFHFNDFHYPSIVVCLIDPLYLLRCSHRISFEVLHITHNIIC